MNHMTQTAYAQPAAPVRTARAVEYDVIARITQRLAAAIRGRKDNHPAFVAALSENEQLWSTLGADVALPDNSLPQTLRARLFYLYRFTFEHSRKVLAGAASPEVLVEINTAVLRGLRGDGGAGA
ncbi:flagellar biosynthesis regulatory protein FlaF [Fuscovulum blasticum DSM 2131]|uniref:Flagellar biosynthesis regulatory protein FlaF n=2 Tax=Fuscovulum blasticum TaxID=1075 RepID=A0A2T4JFH7_FUSBL|nr:flagellar biosynthesis regulatory protein FlaF [Fuscovulum blasticum DSM 2131]